MADETMVQQSFRFVPKPPEPGTLLGLLMEARLGTWAFIQRGQFDNEEVAIALYEVLKGLNRALKVLGDRVHQLHLPGKEEE